MTHISRFYPIVGVEYVNVDGDIYLCIGKYYDSSVIMKNIRTGLTLTAFDVIKHSDGRIEWRHSTDEIMAKEA